MSRERIRRLLTGAFLFLAFCGSASAQCIQNGRAISTWSLSVAALDASAAPGTVLRSQTYNAGGGNLSCTPYRVTSYVETVSPTTSINGVYWRVSRNGTVVSQNNAATVTTFSASPNATYYATPAPYPTVWLLELVRGTGPISSATGQIAFPFLSGTYTTTDPVNRNPWHLDVRGTTQAFTLANSTCTVSTPSISISLGNVGGSTFGNVGSTSPVSAAQNISLSCRGFPTVRMTLQGTQATGAPNTVLAVTGGTGTAQGVGVQLLHNRATVLTINSPLTLSTATPTGNLNVPIAARYYRTGTVVAGRANASPTLRFDYN